MRFKSDLARRSSRCVQIWRFLHFACGWFTFYRSDLLVWSDPGLLQSSTDIQQRVPQDAFRQPNTITRFCHLPHIGMPDYAHCRLSAITSSGSRLVYKYVTYVFFVAGLNRFLNINDVSSTECLILR